MCMYVCMYVCMHACMHTDMRAHGHAHGHARTCMSACMSTSACTYTHMHARIHTCVRDPERKEAEVHDETMHTACTCTCSARRPRCVKQYILHARAHACTDLPAPAYLPYLTLATSQQLQQYMHALTYLPLPTCLT